MNIIHTVFYFVISIGVLVAVHEFGHFWVARRVGVKVLRFSIGFGHVLWRYQKNRTILHTDCSFLPPIKRIWSSWNYQREILAEGQEPLSITYSMNRLQGLNSNQEYCVTLNPQREPRNALYEIEYDHPAFTVQALQSQQELPKIQGAKNTWFCGSYCGYGFHEDGIKAAHAALRTFAHHDN